MAQDSQKGVYMIIIIDYYWLTITAYVFASQKANTQKIIDAIAECTNEINLSDLEKDA